MRFASCCLFAFLIVVNAGCREPEGNDMLSVTESDGVQVNDVGVATFPTPGGWSSNRSNRDTAVILIRSDANRRNPSEMISIDIGMPQSPNARASADAFAKKFSGRVRDLPFDVDGESAYRVSIPANYDQLMPRECIVVHHGNKACFLIAGSKSKSKIWPTLTAIAKSWRWN